MNTIIKEKINKLIDARVDLLIHYSQGKLNLEQYLKQCKSINETENMFIDNYKDNKLEVSLS